jgi:hypothetical protein
MGSRERVWHLVHLSTTNRHYDLAFLRSHMAKKKLRLLKRVPPILGICEGCLVQFKSIFTGAIAAEAEIRFRFAAHKCVHADRSHGARLNKPA